MENLSLDLNQDTSVTLSMIIFEGIESFRFKGSELNRIKLLSIEERPEDLKETETIEELIKLNNIILEEAAILYKEVGEIAQELNPIEEDTKTKIILKPDWDGK